MRGSHGAAVDWLPGVSDEDDDPRNEEAPAGDDERDFYRYTDDPATVNLEEAQP